MSLNNTPARKGKFWLGMVIALPAIAVIASLGTVYVAFTNQDSMVKDNYYKEGLAINRDISQDTHAKQMHINAELEIAANGALTLQLNSDSTLPETVTLELIHNASSDKDLTVQLSTDGSSTYRGQISNTLTGKWFVLASSPQQGWRITHTIYLEEGNNRLSFGHHAH